MPAYVEAPAEKELWLGVVVIHDVSSMTTDLRTRGRLAGVWDSD
jgi:dienelactone hydrolase